MPVQNHTRGGYQQAGPRQRPGPSQTTSALLQDDQFARQGRVVYEDEEPGRPAPSDDGYRDDVRQSVAIGRRGRRRKFVTRHHLDTGAGPDAGDGTGDGPVGSGIGRALRALRGLERQGEVDTCGGRAGSMEVQGRELLSGMRETPVTPGGVVASPDGETSARAQGPVTMGTGRHALVLDASMLAMIHTSRRGGRRGVGRGGVGRGGVGRGGKRASQRPQARRRGTDGADGADVDIGADGAGNARRRCLRRGVHNPLSSKLLAQTDNNSTGTPHQSLDAFVSQLQAPSPDQAPSRVRMRAPTSLMQQVNTVESRLLFDANNARGVSTLRLHVLRVEKEHGKLKCICRCEHSMGLFQGDVLLVIMKQTDALGELHQGAGLILNKPWLVLDGEVEHGVRLPAVFCLGDVSII